MPFLPEQIALQVVRKADEARLLICETQHLLAKYNETELAAELSSIQASLGLALDRYRALAQPRPSRTRRSRGTRGGTHHGSGNGANNGQPPTTGRGHSNMHDDQNTHDPMTPMAANDTASSSAHLDSGSDAVTGVATPAISIGTVNNEFGVSASVLKSVVIGLPCNYPKKKCTCSVPNKQPSTQNGTCKHYKECGFTNAANHTDSPSAGAPVNKSQGSAEKCANTTPARTATAGTKINIFGRPKSKVMNPISNESATTRASASKANDLRNKHPSRIPTDPSFVSLQPSMTKGSAEGSGPTTSPKGADACIQANRVRFSEGRETAARASSASPAPSPQSGLCGILIDLDDGLEVICPDPKVIEGVAGCLSGDGESSPPSGEFEVRSDILSPEWE